jgi:transcriptional regulator with XRE-family HTH domain
MKPVLTKSERVALFRERLAATMREQELNRSTLAQRAGVDRSTVSLLLSEHQPRLPSGHVVADLATALGVTTDWLLGLAASSQAASEMVQESTEMAVSHEADAYVQIERWMEEAGDAKIRSVPSTLPPFVKTDAVMTLETTWYASRNAEHATAHSKQGLALSRMPGRDMEFALPAQLPRDIAQRVGYWSGLTQAQAQDQLHRMADLCEELYPSVRMHLFDLRQHFSASITIFGQRRAAIYIGSAYLVLNTTGFVQGLTKHFDQLVRHAVVRSHEVPNWLRDIARQSA